MCGIAGYLSRSTGPAAGAEPVGRILLDMLTGLARRGPDSAGLALFGSGKPDIDVAWVRLPADEDPTGAELIVRQRLDELAEIGHVEHHAGLVRLELRLRASARDVTHALERPGEDFELVSLGRHLELIKQVGAPGDLERSFAVTGFRGSHGIGHTRLSTESRVDLSHSQPFWAHGVADLATVHNGHITNYGRMRRIYEQQGVRFFSENDSEIIGVYLADQLARGLTLEEAVEKSLDDLDGAFTYLVATPDAIGYARDPFAFKPLVVVETPTYVAIANEEIAIRQALGPAGVGYEPTGHVYRIWRREPIAVGVAA